MPQITDYKCPACTGPLHYVGKSGKLECDYCGLTYDVAEIEAIYSNSDSVAKPEDIKEPKPTSKVEAESEFDMSEMSDDWGKDANGMKVYNCPSCGAALITDATTAATSCPYCGNNAIVPGQLDGTLKPDYVIPFKLDKAAAKNALKNHYRKHWLLPNVFSSTNHINEIKGIYVPFWLFDTEVYADCVFRGTRSVTVREGNENVTTVSYYDIHRAGNMTFEHLPTDASKKMPNDYMDSIEPYDYDELKPFSTAYLPGYFADKYDISAHESAPRADRRCRKSVIEYMRSDIFGYESLSLTGDNMKFKRGKVHYALLPVWTLRTKWKDKDYLFMMNGQTGKLVGDQPTSEAKLIGIFVAIAIVLSVLMLYLHVGDGIFDLLFG